MSIHFAMLLLRSLIVCAYASMLFPWIMYYFTNFWLFGIVGLLFTFLGGFFLSRAIDDWKYPDETKN